jgi:hypothetical protein
VYIRGLPPPKGSLSSSLGLVSLIVAAYKADYSCGLYLLLHYTKLILTLPRKALITSPLLEPLNL